MAKLTLTNDDGSTQDFNDQAYTDAAVAQALASVGPSQVVEISAGQKVEIKAV